MPILDHALKAHKPLAWTLAAVLLAVAVVAAANQEQSVIGSEQKLVFAF